MSSAKLDHELGSDVLVVVGKSLGQQFNEPFDRIAGV